MSLASASAAAADPSIAVLVAPTADLHHALHLAPPAPPAPMFEDPASAASAAGGAATTPTTTASGATVPSASAPGSAAGTDAASAVPGTGAAADAANPDMTLRSLVSTKEAGVVIGKGGSSVAGIREITMVKLGVSKVVPGVPERILTIVGPLQNVAKAYALVAKNLLDNSAVIGANMADSTSVRLLVAHQLVGSIIGKAGSKIREIQEESGAKIVVSKEMLPQSTERVVEVYGVVDAIHLAIYHIGLCIRSDSERAAGIILYDPQSSQRYSASAQFAITSPLTHRTMTAAAAAAAASAQAHGGHAIRMHDDRIPRDHREPRDVQFAAVPPSAAGGRRGPLAPQHMHVQHQPHMPHHSAASAFHTSIAPLPGHPRAVPAPGVPADPLDPSAEPISRTLNVPADMVGCIIGKGGSFINQIRRLSGAKLHIAEQVDGRNDREVTIIGTDQASQKALNLLYNQLEAEKQRRLSQAAVGVEDDGRVQR